MYAFKWANLYNTILYAADGDGGGSEAPAAPAAAGAGGGGGADGGASAPASSPAPDGAPSALAAPAPSGDFDWSALGSTDDLDHIEIPAVPPSVVVPPQEAPVTPVQTPPAPAPAQPQVPPQAAQEGQQPQGAERPLSASDPLSIASGIEANRDAIVAHLAQSKFALSEEDIKDLDTDVTVAVPKLLARVFLESQVSMQRFLAQAVPGMVQKYNKVSSANEGAEKKFFDSHKALDRNNPQHREAVVRMATVYRQANPGLPLDQLIQEVGPMVMTALRIGAIAPAAQRAAPRGGTPFMPAVNGGGGLSPTTEPPNEWAGLGQNFDE